MNATLGPAIGATAFEVGAEVRAAFTEHAGEHIAEVESAFLPTIKGKATEKYRANLYQLARQRLTALGITRIFGGDFCTHTDAERFFSYRRDGRTGRMASLIYRID